MKLKPQFFNRSADVVARGLIGAYLASGSGPDRTLGRIVETEAYIENDLANHARFGPESRAKPMFGQASTLYIYQIYGKHHCLNVVTGPVGIGEAVLIRALEPVTGITLMQKRRGVANLLGLCSGPAKLVEALDIKPQYNALPLSRTPIRFFSPDHFSARPPVRSQVISVGLRIGISNSQDLPLRFYIQGNPYVSRLNN